MLSVSSAGGLVTGSNAARIYGTPQQSVLFDCTGASGPKECRSKRRAKGLGLPAFRVHARFTHLKGLRIVRQLIERQSAGIEQVEYRLIYDLGEG